jgi:hypothetical protein
MKVRIAVAASVVGAAMVAGMGSVGADTAVPAADPSPVIVSLGGLLGGATNSVSNVVTGLLGSAPSAAAVPEIPAAPKLPAVAVPTISAPTVPVISVPRLLEIRVPVVQLPAPVAGQVPTVTMPVVEVPQVQVPDTSSPDSFFNSVLEAVGDVFRTFHIDLSPIMDILRNPV